MIFQHKQKPSFIPKPQYDPRVYFLTDLYKLVNYPPIPIKNFVEIAVDKPCKALSNLAARVITNANYQLYTFPVVRRYYGDSFVHGLAVQVENDNRVHYVNIDDTEEAQFYLLELTTIVSQVFSIFLERYDIYIYVEGEYFSFIEREKLRRLKDVKIDGRIAWSEHPI